MAIALSTPIRLSPVVNPLATGVTVASTSGGRRRRTSSAARAPRKKASELAKGIMNETPTSGGERLQGSQPPREEALEQREQRSGHEADHDGLLRGRMELGGALGEEAGDARPDLDSGGRDALRGEQLRAWDEEVERGDHRHRTGDRAEQLPHQRLPTRLPLRKPRCSSLDPSFGSSRRVVHTS
jgi:hypothetical protein